MKRAKGISQVWIRRMAKEYGKQIAAEVLMELYRFSRRRAERVVSEAEMKPRDDMEFVIGLTR